MLNIVYMGLVGLGSVCLKALLENDYDIKLVITEPELDAKESGIIYNTFKKSYDEYCKYDYMEEYCSKRNIPLIRTAEINTREIINRISMAKPDLIIVALFHRILPAEILNIPSILTINVHPAYLPENRGGTPVIWQILNNDSYTGVTIHKMTEQIDSGDIINQRKIPIHPKDTSGSLYNRILEEAPALLLDTLKQIRTGEYSLTPQDEEKATKNRPYKIADSNIDFNSTADFIERQVRAGNPYFPAHFDFKDEVVLVWEADVHNDYHSNYDPGEVVLFNDETGLLIQTSKGCIGIKKVQYANKKSEIMDIPDFLETLKND